MGESGFEPLKAVPADLQSVPFGHSGIPPDLRDAKPEIWTTASLLASSDGSTVLYRESGELIFEEN